MTGRTWARLVPFEADRPERRSGADRRGEGDRRTRDFFREMGRPCFDLRERPERRSGEDRRGPRPKRVSTAPEVVMPWQIIPRQS